MGFDTPELIRVLFAGNALPANQILPPGVGGHDPSLPSKSVYDPAARTRAARPLRLSGTATATATASGRTARR